MLIKRGRCISLILVVMITLINILQVNSIVGATSNAKAGSSIDKHLGGLLAGKGNVFVEVGNKYKVDAYLLAAIAIHETGRGTSKALRDHNNVGGYMKSKGGLMSFSSIDASIEFGGKLLSGSLYIGGGKDTVEKIRNTYAPGGVANDPTNLNRHWVGAVNGYYKDITGRAPGRFTLDWSGTKDGSGSVALEEDGGSSVSSGANEVELDSKYKEYLGIKDESKGAGVGGEVSDIDTHLNYGMYRVTRVLVKVVRWVTIAIAIVATVLLVVIWSCWGMYSSGVPIVDDMVSKATRGKINFSEEDINETMLKITVTCLVVLGLVISGTIDRGLGKILSKLLG